MPDKRIGAIGGPVSFSRALLAGALAPDGSKRTYSDSKSFVCFVVFAHLARRTVMYAFAAVRKSRLAYK
ncbi:hypothetical protein [Fretibacterium sp. OH1220_COT-178]|uniref:hypothetical protein n=1 Tax=Fretibacterium sp. OH1220_COT-178 TaxID=2491047 RepID=UPI000F601ACA|nr:hypothetical protein [Fretibacterium sp. OH1220_COT-178]